MENYGLRTITVEKSKQLIPDEAVRQSFLQRKDISCLPPDEQERRWRKHLVCVEKARKLFCGFPGTVLGEQNHGE